MLIKNSLINSIAISAIVILFIVPSFAQQNLTQPRVSQQASVSQRVGLTDITIDYHRPGVNNREIWGKLVPYDQVWRAGANENTTISFSSEVIINGNKVPAGKYGLHMIPTEKDWTIILSKDNAAWGSFFYDESKDQLRFSSTTEAADHEEWLSYSFADVSPNSATLNLRWEKLSIPIKIEVDVNKLVAENMERELTGLPGFGWQGWNQIASYYLFNDMDTDKAISFIDQSIQINSNVTNNYTKSVLLEIKGNVEEASKLREGAFVNAAENQVNALGYQYLFGGKTDNAMYIFKKNVEMYPESWNVYDSLGECYAADNNNEKAKEFYTKALERAPEGQKDRIKRIIANLN